MSDHQDRSDAWSLLSPPSTTAEQGPAEPLHTRKESIQLVIAQMENQLAGWQLKSELREASLRSNWQCPMASSRPLKHNLSIHISDPQADAATPQARIQSAPTEILLVVRRHHKASLKPKLSLFKNKLIPTYRLHYGFAAIPANDIRLVPAFNFDTFPLNATGYEPLPTPTEGISLAAAPIAEASTTAATTL
ncbi:MAG: hypothetical protein MMC33_006879 [Icmadophila ericetorum]|nr:hypothetical protein [Icmadophila ericetorum]